MISALLIIDMQNDFIIGDSMLIDGAEEIIPLINKLHQ